MTSFQLETTTDESPSCCGHIAGTPHLPDNSEWPRCRMCDGEMVAFIDLIVPECETSPFQTGGRLQLFACRTHNEISGSIYTDFEPFEKASGTDQLPTEYWGITDGHYLVRLLPPSQKLTAARPESQLIQQFIVANPSDDDGADGFKLFGEPHWFQDPEQHTCCCGAPMKLLLQIPENYPFPMADGAEEQEDSFSSTDYCLFLGNQLYLLACTKQCDPLALWAVLQG